MPERLELTADVVSASAGLDADQAGWENGQPLRVLGAGELNAGYDGATFIQADEMSVFLPRLMPRVRSQQRKKTVTWDVLLTRLKAPLLTGKRGRSTAVPSG
jgi:hypothetical protein